MSRRSFLRTLTAGACAATLLREGSGAPGPRRPNVVLILADDQGWGDLSVHGNANLKTPNIDSLARDGAIFDRFFVCPVCSPTRAEVLTGRYHPRGGVYSTSTGGERLNLDEKTIADAFQAAGYATGAFGKWHNGTQYPYHPMARGFDEYYGFTSGHWGQYFDPVLDHNGKLVRGKGFIIDDLTDHAMDFMTRNKAKPFFCYIPYNTPHSPFQIPDEYWDRFKGKNLSMLHRSGKDDLDKTRSALALCENIDWNVGRILKKLDALGIADDTIVLYFSDNGPNGVRWNGDMQGRKGSTDEGGVRVPCLVRWPGRIPKGRRIPQIAGAIDLLPTLTAMAGIPTVSTKPLDGKDVSPLLTTTVTQWPDRTILSTWRGRVSVRSQQYRLDHKGKLFDLTADPGQRKDIAKAKPDVARRLKADADTFRAEVLPGNRSDDRPLPVGYPDFPTTLLPARDGVPHGQVKRSNRFPNCTFFQNWTGKDDSMTWDIEVATAGSYEAVVLYTCPEQDVGSTIELSFNGAALKAKVTEAHDPPLKGMEFERVKRGESYVKDFRPLPLGTFQFKKGRGPLTLRALDIAGKTVMDVRSVLLTLQT
jgi:arylsulfatase A-like enzyme